MRFDCPGSHKVCGAVLGRGIFPAIFLLKWLLWNLDCVLTSQARMTCMSAFWAVRLLSSLGCAQPRTKCFSAFYFWSSLVTSSLRLVPKPSIYAICYFGLHCLWSNCLTHEPTHRIGESWHAFRLRTLAQSLRRGLWPRHAATFFL